MHADSGGSTGLTRSQLAKQRREQTGAKRLFADESEVSGRLMRPGLSTRISDGIVSWFARFEKDKPEPDVIDQDPATSVSRTRLVIGFTITTAAFIIAGRREQAALFFGAQAALLLAGKAWFDWHKRNPPREDAGSTRRGIFSALLHAVGGFAAGLIFFYVIELSIPMLADDSNWEQSLQQLLICSALAVLAYQRRTGWKHDDPERLLIIGVVAVGFAALVSVVQLLF